MVSDVQTLCAAASAALLALLPSSLGAEPFTPATAIRLVNGSWRLNGKPTYLGSRAEGLLLNASMLNATFEDRNPATRPKDFDPERNTSAFLDRVPEYVASGVRAFTLGLQGGSPGYAGALNSAFHPDGSLRPDYMQRVARAIEGCDRAGAAVILCAFHQEQDQVLLDNGAVQKAVVNAAAWIRDRRYTNVLFEVADEFPQKGYDHQLIREDTSMRQLIRLARETCPGLLAAASGGPGGRLDHPVAIESDFLLLHFSNVAVDEILERVASADKVSKAIVCNADRRGGEEGAHALEAAVNALASWGFLNWKKNQQYPFRFEGVADDPIVYAKFKELTAPRK